MIRIPILPGSKMGFAIRGFSFRCSIDEHSQDEDSDGDGLA